MSHIPVLTVSVPEYYIDSEPDHHVVGKPVDDLLRQHFMGETILIRAVGSQEHSGKSVDELINIIKSTGSDRYDAKRVGDRYDNIDDKHIDLFALRRKVTDKSKIFWQLTWSFFNFPPPERRPIWVDIVIIYDSAKLRAVRYQPNGHPANKRDGYIFKDPTNKPEAIKAIIKIA